MCDKWIAKRTPSSYFLGSVTNIIRWVISGIQCAWKHKILSFYNNVVQISVLSNFVCELKEQNKLMTERNSSFSVYAGWLQKNFQSFCDSKNEIQWKPVRTKFVTKLNSLYRGCPMALKIWGVWAYWVWSESTLICMLNVKKVINSSNFIRSTVA